MIKSAKLLLILSLLFVISCDNKSAPCPELQSFPVSFSNECIVVIDTEEVEDKFYIINSAEELNNYVQFTSTGNSCTNLVQQLNQDFEQHTLLIGKKVLPGIHGKLISQAIDFNCDSRKLTYKVTIQNGGFTALGNFYYGMLVSKLPENIRVETDITIIN